MCAACCVCVLCGVSCELLCDVCVALRGSGLCVVRCSSFVVRCVLCVVRVVCCVSVVRCL